MSEDGLFKPKANLSRGEAANAILLTLIYLKAHDYISKEFVIKKITIVNGICIEVDVSDVVNINRVHIFLDNHVSCIEIFPKVNII